MSWFGLPRSYFAYALVQVLTPLLMWLAGATEVRPFSSGTLIWILLAIALGRRSAFAWGLLLVWHGFLVVFPVLFSVWPWAAPEVVLMLVSATSIGLLLSRSMRRHLDDRPDRAISPPSPTA